MKFVYVAHPISGDVAGNIAKIKQIIRHINLTEPDVVPLAHYVVDCESLDDTVPAERERGIRNDNALLGAGFIKELRLYGDRISNGMSCECELAVELGIEIIPMTPGTTIDFLRYIKYDSK